MSALAELDRLRNATLVDEDGDPVTPEFLPGLDESAIRAIEQKIGAGLPADLYELLVHCSGIEGLLDPITFRGNADFEMAEIFPHGLPIAGDGFGNFWVVDALSAPENAAQIYFACHDAPIVLFQSNGIADFLIGLREMYTPPHTSRLDDVHEDRRFQVWQRNPGTLEHAEALKSDDSEVRLFAGRLDSRFHVVDLRRAPPGMGFSWGRFGPQTEIRRHGEQRIFACAQPPPKPGLLARLFGSR
jgi:hypothetical protein